MKLAEKTAPKFRDPAAVFEFIKDEFDPIGERMHAIVLNSQNKVIEKILLSVGGSGNIHIDRSALLRRILVGTNGNNIVLVHNHPSENLDPSEEDLHFTKSVQESFKSVGLNLLDHIIYSRTEFYSMRQKRLID